MLQQFEKWIAPMGRRAIVRLHLPDDYEQNIQERYPVIYMFDGQNLFEDEQATFGKSWGLEKFAASYGKPVIIVGIDCDRRGSERLQEYMPYPIENTFFGRAEGRGARFAQWIVEELKPYVDRFWRTWPQRGATAVAGSSMGGLMSMYIIMHYNEIFSKAACLSPSFMACPEKIMEDLYEYKMDPDTRIYLSFGAQELSPQNRIAAQRQLQDLQSILHEKGCRSVVRVIADGRHNEECWEKQNQDVFDYFWYNPQWADIDEG